MSGAPPATDLDVAAVQAWILTLGLDARPPLTFERIGNGLSNLTFRVADAGAGRWVLRRPPHGTLLASAHDMARERRILAALEPTAVPAPAVVGFTEDPAVAAVPLLVMEHVDGRVIDTMAVAEGMAPEERRRSGAALPGVLAAIHAVDLERTGLTTLARHAPYADRQLRRWRRQWESARTRDLPGVDELAARLEAGVPEQRETTLVHGDFHLLNVISDPQTGAVRAVLDWELSTLGDPLADVGGLLAYWPQAGDAAPALFPAPALDGFPTRAELVAAYAQATGRDVSAVGFWHALALWKLTIICDGVVRRAREDPRNAGGGGSPGPSDVDDLLARAREAAAGAGI